MPTERVGRLKTFRSDLLMQRCKLRIVIRATTGPNWSMGLKKNSSWLEIFRKLSGGGWLRLRRSVRCIVRWARQFRFALDLRPGLPILNSAAVVRRDLRPLLVQVHQVD